MDNARQVYVLSLMLAFLVDSSSQFSIASVLKVVVIGELVQLLSQHAMSCITSLITSSLPVGSLKQLVKFVSIHVGPSALLPHLDY